MNGIVEEYSRGLFALAEEEKTERLLLDETRALSPLFTDEYVHLLINPNIPKEELKKITARTLVIAGDRDMIKRSHTKLISENNAIAIPTGKIINVKGSVSR